MTSAPVGPSPLARLAVSIFAMCLTAAAAPAPGTAAAAPCADCRTATAALAVPVATAGLAAGCNAVALRDFAATVLAVLAPRVAPGAADGFAEAAATLPATLRLGAREQVALAFRPVLDGAAADAGCAPLAVLLPRGGEVVAARMTVRDDATVVCDTTDGACPGAALRFVSPLRVAVGGRDALVSGFAGAAAAGRVVSLSVSYR